MGGRDANQERNVLQVGKDISDLNVPYKVCVCQIYTVNDQVRDSVFKRRLSVSHLPYIHMYKAGALPTELLRHSRLV